MCMCARARHDDAHRSHDALRVSIRSYYSLPGGPLSPFGPAGPSGPGFFAIFIRSSMSLSRRWISPVNFLFFSVCIRCVLTTAVVTMNQQLACTKQRRKETIIRILTVMLYVQQIPFCIPCWVLLKFVPFRQAISSPRTATVTCYC
jgi:hypothetical protein